MKIKYKDEQGNLFYKCWNCSKEFNFKAMKYITDQKDSCCPMCDKRIKLT